jgi:outer membrane lipoprotein-sorting protein
MRTFMTAVLATLLVAFAAALPAQAQNGVPELEKYLNSFKSAKARFVQSNPNGSVVQGTLYLRRPGRMRFEYDPPSTLKIVADGSQVTLWDPATRDFGQWPIGWTAATFLVRENLSLSGDLRVEKIDRVNGLLEFTMSQTRKPQEGKVIVRLSENPLTLRGWTIIDNKGRPVTVSLNDLQTGVQIADSIFKNDGPDPSVIRRQPF